MRVRWEPDGVVPPAAKLDELAALVAEARLAAQALAARGTATEPGGPGREGAELARVLDGFDQAIAALRAIPSAGIFHDGARELQDRHDTRRLADRIEQLVLKPGLGESERAFVEAADCFFLATSDEFGRPNCSYKGGDPGLVAVLDERTIVFPCYDGNGMFLSMGNLTRNPHVGMLFIDFEKGHRLRINGTATLSTDPPGDLGGSWPEAQFVVVVQTREVFQNCPRYVHRRVLERRSSFVPRPCATTPVPTWKTSGWAADVLPEHDPARDPQREVRDT